MSKNIKIFKDGRVYEMQDDQALTVKETKRIVRLLIEALQFSQAETFTIAADEAVSPDVPEARTATRKINPEGLKLIKRFEGLHDLKQGSQGVYVEAYRDPVNVWTIGWGCTEGVYEGMTITVEQAEKMLQDELEQFETAVANCVAVEIDENQFSALVCFSYNVGARALFESTLLKLLNQGKFQEAADQFLRWDKAGGQSLLGLSRRRRAERALFLSQPWETYVNWKPSGVLRLAESGQPLMQGDEVGQLQTALARAGFGIQVDGIFGNDTDKAVRQFQQQNGLTVDGIVGDETRTRLGI